MVSRNNSWSHAFCLSGIGTAKEIGLRVPHKPMSIFGEPPVQCPYAKDWYCKVIHTRDEYIDVKSKTERQELQTKCRELQTTCRELQTERPEL